jgi:cation diffusion facilitator CzcD-associated flavoprotein CzcO
MSADDEQPMSNSVCAPVPANLAELDALVQRDLQLLNYPPANWVTPREAAQPVADVAIIGAGMCGLSAAFALLRRGVRNVRILDRNADGFEGPWLSFARMRTLRSPKHLTGPAQGLPNLTCRAWFEAQWGTKAWQGFERLPRTQWMDYLRWYRKVLNLPVENEVNVRRIIAPQADSQDAFTLELECPDGPSVALARKVVVAGGRDCLGLPRVPEPFEGYYTPGDMSQERSAEARQVQHSAEAIDFDSMRGRTVAVIGIGASAMDNAALALESGAAAVHMLVRAAAVPRINKAKGIVYAGHTEGFPHLDDAQKLHRLAYIARCRVAPPRHSVLRVASHDAFELHMDTQVQRVERERANPKRLLLHTQRESLAVDHVILATGFGVDLAATPELVDFRDQIALWRDCVEPMEGDHDSEFLKFPYLGEAFEFTERNAGLAPYLRDVHCFNYAAAPSHGNVSGDIPSVSDGAERLANGIVRQFFMEDAPLSWQALQDFDDPELLGDELHDVSWWPPLAES